MRLLRYYCHFNPAQQLGCINFILAIIGAVLRIKGLRLAGTAGRGHPNLSGPETHGAVRQCGSPGTRSGSTCLSDAGSSSPSIPLSAAALWGGSRNRFLWKVTWSGASAVPTRGSLRSSSVGGRRSSRSGLALLGPIPHRGVPAAPLAMLRSPPTSQVAAETSAEAKVPETGFQSKGRDNDSGTE